MAVWGKGSRGSRESFRRTCDAKGRERGDGIKVVRMLKRLPRDRAVGCVGEGEQG